MPIKPVSDWSSSYEDIFYKNVTVDTQPMLWGKWVDQNTQGLSAASPYNIATVTLNRASFPPVTAPPAPTPAPFCSLLANAWFAYIGSAIWAPCPPIPPFSAIASVTPSMVGIAAAQASLMASLIAAMTPPSMPDKVRAMQISTAFYTATLASGIMISGTSLPSPTPIPLVLPLMPVM